MQRGKQMYERSASPYQNCTWPARNTWTAMDCITEIDEQLIKIEYIDTV